MALIKTAALLVFFFFISLYAPAQNGPSSAYRSQAVLIAASLDDSGLAAQVLLTGIDGNSRNSQSQRALLERIPAGGIMLFRYNLDTSKENVKDFLAETAGIISAGTGIPPFMAADHEGGLVHRFGPGVERLPSAYSFWQLAQRSGRARALEEAELIYRRSAAEIGELGINMVLAPVAEILSEENRPFLQTRSYGHDADFTREAAAAYIRALNSAGITSVLKHFPGNSGVDPHYNIPVLNAERPGLDEMAGPFAALISELAPPSVMISHVVVNALDPGVNASLSRAVIEGWLRSELGFEGIVMADDFAMAAVAAGPLSQEEAIIQALRAGADMIMVWPQNINSAHRAILQALEDGSLPRARLEEAAQRIITEKLRYGIIR